jgi:hypothetical protein
MLFSKSQCRVRPVKAISLFLFILCVVRIFISNQPFSFSQHSSSKSGFTTSSSNSTLGFGQIYVISQKDSPRRKSIIQAANVTELQLSIPIQPIWTEQDERNFRLDQGSSIGKGSLLAWFGHLNALHQ